MSYLHRPEANLAGKFIDGAKVWHRMGDMGYLDEEGQLYFCGRRVHMVTTPDRVFHSVPVEDVFNQHLRVRRSALIEWRGTPALVVEPAPHDWPTDQRSKEQFVTELLVLGAADPITAPIKTIFFHQSFPVDARHNAKIFRDKLSLWARTETPVQIGVDLQVSSGAAS
jgi:acyl-coenzyme A synthetase/AMP-(fatty) acid ligase